ncbi:NAD(P)-dependent oxidoreductase [Streptomyces sp. CA-111067]|uniref:NAD(P)-dependent oxidoreductase n=1 Tax=Streptomyces sp. CA-111067 TaxID=3240046 RepID=UPI003D995B6A
MKLTVFGASGGVGRLVVQQALAAGHDVTAVVRDPGRLPAAPAEGLQVATVTDVLDPVTLVPALTGRDAVISAIGPAGNKQARTGPIAGPAARSIVRAMDQAGVSRIAAISAAPVGPPAHDENVLVRALVLPLLRRLLSALYADLADQEAALAASGTDWTVVRPPMLLDKPHTGTYRRALGANVRVGRTIPRADVADALLACLDDPSTFRASVGIAT